MKYLLIVLALCLIATVAEAFDTRYRSQEGVGQLEVIADPGESLVVSRVDPDGTRREWVAPSAQCLLDGNVITFFANGKAVFLSQPYEITVKRLPPIKLPKCGPRKEVEEAAEAVIDSLKAKTSESSPDNKPKKMTYGAMLEHVHQLQKEYFDELKRMGKFPDIPPHC